MGSRVSNRENPVEMLGRCVRAVAGLAVAIMLLGAVPGAQAAAGLEGFVSVNGVRLQYLDWGGAGEWLILIHGLGDNPHAFDDFAPAFTDRFHVIAYARRGSGGSDVKAPYDAATLTQDLRGLMDALGIARANLVGYSAAGAEVTEMAARHPDRVTRIIYMEGGYDGADPEANALIRALPQGFFDPPASAMTSLDAFRAYQKSTQYVDLDDMGRIEANLRQKVIIQGDGSLQHRIPKEVVGALYSAMLTDKRRDYSPIRCPALALYADTLYNLHSADAARRKQLTAFERQYWQPFQAKSIAQLRRQLPSARIVHVPGTHDGFFLTARSQVVSTMRDFLLSTGTGEAQSLDAAPAPVATALAPRFEISFPAAVHAQPVTGRLFLLISQHNDPEVRLQSMWFNSPEIVAVDVARWAPGEATVIDAKPLGTPLPSLSALPAGDYYVQAVLNVYTEFHRADGHVVWAHLDQGEGQQFNRSPGNLYSKVRKLHLEGAGTFNLSLEETIPPLLAPPDSQWVKHLRIQSQLLTRFWGHPIYLGAVVLLPRDYAADPAARYPVIYYQPEHFRSFPAFEFDTESPPARAVPRDRKDTEGAESGFEFAQAWQAEHFPRLIAVSLQTPTPFSDWSGAIDSANNGPYDQAIMTELIPAIESRFRVIQKPYARVLTGKHSGGRAALALQLHHASFFGGAWVFHPWPFNFKRWSALDIYDSDNAYTVGPTVLPEGLQAIAQWLPLERYVARTTESTPFVTLRQLSQHDAVMASMAAGDPIGADDFINGPVGENGYPKRLWDRATGRIDPEVAAYWREHGDLADYAERNWTRVGPDLVDKLHFYIGDADIFYRDEGVRLFEAFLQSTRNPHYEGTFVYSARRSGWQPMTNAELVRMMADHIARHAPQGTPTKWLNP